jgi:acyl-CoA synthetase (AMP-forming)/AMP-acid ligase II
VKIFNEYGPTEAVVGCAIHRWDADADRGPDVPIGRASSGAEVFVLDRYERPTPIGAWGELYVRRAGMASGYLNLPSETEARFGEIEAVGGPALYRTGDRVRVEHGVLVYGGRTDDQMKVGGVRLEPGEIESALVRHEMVASAVVRVWTPGGGRVVRCVRCGLGSDVPDIAIDGAGVCSVCREFDRVEPQTRTWFRDLDDLEQIRQSARRRSAADLDCIHLLSGGKDSTYALYQLVAAGWRVHAVTLDNGFIADGAKANIRRTVADLGISHEFLTTDAMNEIFRDPLPMSPLWARARCEHLSTPKAWPGTMRWP